MRERLMQLIHDAHMAIADRDDNRDTYTAIADYLLDNGVIVPPVKVGQTVYQTDGTRIYELTVNGGSVLVYDTDSIAFSDEAIGKSIFLTREAAEAALKAREQNA